MQGVLQGIMNPEVADIAGGLRRGGALRQQNLSQEMVGNILKETIGGKLGSLGEIDPQAAIGLAEAFQIPVGQEDRIKSMFGDAQAVVAVLQNGGTPQEAAQLLAPKVQLLESLGIEPTQYIETMRGLNAGNPETIEGLFTLVNVGQNAGFLKKPEDKAGAEIRKEVRGNLSKEVKELSKEEGVIKTNYNRIRSLGEKVRKGNRSAVAQALVSLVKLGDPTSVVKDSEMIAALNAKNPTAALTGLLQGSETREDVQQAILRSIDPLNPNTVNVDDLFATADSIVLSSIPSIQDRFADAEVRAKDNLTEAGIISLFGKGNRLGKRISGLSELVAPQETGSRPAVVEVDF